MLGPEEDTYGYRDTLSTGIGIEGSIASAALARCRCDGVHCVLVQCPAPDITHGQLKPAQNFTYGSTATLECDAGYIPVGATTIVRCLSNGRWHPRMPACILEVQCPNLTIHHGREISPRKAEYTFGNQVELQCDPGYVLRGSQRIQCWSDGTWRPPVPYCDKGECEWREQGGCQELHLCSGWEQQGLFKWFMIFTVP
uniref:Sushi domain-containing protein n=1 Tax=Buteo japonicus TaxID=224669 RepID=A0A8B9Z271_9AVES